MHGEGYVCVIVFVRSVLPTMAMLGKGTRQHPLSAAVLLLKTRQLHSLCAHKH